MERERTIERQRTGRRRWLVISLALTVSALGAAGCGSDSSSTSTGSDGGTHRLSGVVPTPVPDVSKVTLPEASAAASPVGFTAKTGELTLVYFGYTACPDICPTTLADVRTALRDLGSESNKVSVVFTTIDPRRDTAEVVTNYLHSFFPLGTALRTEDNTTLTAVTTAFGATYKTDYTDPNAPRVLHSAYVYAVDDRGRIVVEWPFGSTARDMADDIHLLLKKETS